MFVSQSGLGGSLLGQKNYADAEPLLRQGYDGMKQREGQIPSHRKVRLSEAVDRLVELCEALNQPDEAAKWKAERAKLTPAPEKK